MKLFKPLSRSFCIVLLLLAKSTFSQTVLESYDEFGGAATNGQEAAAFALAEKVLPQVDSLSKRQQAIFYYKLAGLHEGRKHRKEAVDFYQRSLKLEPYFYVPHLALGYLYLEMVNDFAGLMNAEKKDTLLYTRLKNRYEVHLRKAITHLEKAQACDPDEEALKIIKNGYQMLKDPVSLNTLDQRVKELAINCMSVLAEE